MMILHCTGGDPNLTDAAGNRGQCGQSFDDRRRSTVCPHEELIYPTIEINPSALARYTFHTNARHEMFIHCNYHAMPSAAATTAFPHWGQVRGVADALAWIEYHEQTSRHPSAEATSPAAARTALSVVGMLAREVRVPEGHLHRVLTTPASAEWAVQEDGYLRAVPAATDEGAGMADVSRETSAEPTQLMPRVLDGGDPDDGPMGVTWFESVEGTEPVQARSV